jgi:hypothetical protein
MEDGFSISTIRDVTVIRFDARATLADAARALERAQEADKKGLRLWDLSKGVLASTEDVRALAMAAKGMQFPPSRIAVMAPADVTFGLARMFQVFRNQKGQQYKVFRTEPEAMAWLEDAGDLEE